MSIIRVNHTEKYVVISKAALEDPNLSFKAKGLWAYCMSLPNNWNFNVEHLASVSKEKHAAIYSALDELIKFGYCTRNQVNQGKGEGKGRGSFGRTEYIVFEECQIKINLTLRGFPHPSHPHPSNRALISNKSNNDPKEEASNKGGKTAAATSLEEEIKKSRRIKDEDKPLALEYVKSHRKKFKEADNPMGLLITIVDAGDHKKNFKDPKIIEKRMKWGEKHEMTGGAGSRGCTREGYFIVDGSREEFYKWDSKDVFWDNIGLGFDNILECP